MNQLYQEWIDIINNVDVDDIARVEYHVGDYAMITPKLWTYSGHYKLWLDGKSIKVMIGREVDQL